MLHFTLPPDRAHRREDHGVRPPYLRARTRFLDRGLGWRRAYVSGARDGREAQPHDPERVRPSRRTGSFAHGRQVHEFRVERLVHAPQAALFVDAMRIALLWPLTGFRRAVPYRQIMFGASASAALFVFQVGAAEMGSVCWQAWAPVFVGGGGDAVVGGLGYFRVHAAEHADGRFERVSWWREYIPCLLSGFGTWACEMAWDWHCEDWRCRTGHC